MDDLTAKKPLEQMPSGISPNFEALHKRFPSSAYLRARAPKNVPRFSFEYGDTGAGADVGIARQLGGVRPDQDRAALWRHHHRAADRRRLVRHALRRADRHRADGRAVAGVAGRRPDDGEGGAARARALHARRRRRRHHRGGRQGRARRVLAAALSFLPERPRHRFRPDQAGDRGRRQGAGAHHRRAGAHHAHARKLRRLGPRIPSDPAHALRNDGAAEMADGAAAQRLSALRHHPAILPAGRQHQRGHRLLRARTWAACFPGKKSRAIATAGKGRCWSRASCIRPTPKKRCRSASKASGYRTTAAGRSRRWRRRSTCCRRSSPRSGRRRPSCSTAASAAART